MNIQTSQEKKEYKSTSAIDIAFSPDKTVTLTWALSPEEQRHAIEKAQQMAVYAAFTVIEQNAYRRLSTHSEKAQIIAGVFQHSTARATEKSAPTAQLHSHVCIPNIAVSESGSGALHVKRLLSNGNLHHYGAVYNNELAHHLKALGFELETVHLNKGSVSRIVNTGLTKEHLSHFSKRSHEIDRHLEQFPEKSRTQAVIDSRKQKEKEINRQALFARMKEEMMKEFGYDLQKVIVQPKEIKKDTSEIGRQVISDLQKRGSIAITASDVEKSMLKASEGRFSHKEIEELSRSFVHTHLHEIKGGAKKTFHEKEKVSQNPRKFTIHFGVFPKESREKTAKVPTSHQSSKDKDSADCTKDEKTKVYTLSNQGRQKDSVYSIVRSKLIKPLQKLLPEGRPLSYEYRKKQYEKSARRFERRQKTFKRKLFFSYMAGRISHKQYLQYRDGRTKETKLSVNLKWIFGRMKKNERDFLIRTIDKQKTQEKEVIRTQEEMQQQKPNKQHSSERDRSR